MPVCCGEPDLLPWRSVCSVRDETPQNLFSQGQFACNRYNESVEKKIFWIVFMVLGLVADVVPIWWGLLATIPIAFVSWWVAYRSEWF